MNLNDLKARINPGSPPIQPVRTAPPDVPDHELVRRIGMGSYGEVWLARNAVGTWRAVKVVFRDRFQDARPYEREFIGIQKYEPISRTNEGLVDVLQIGRNDAEGYFYYVMELADEAEPLGGEDGRWKIEDGQSATVCLRSSILDPRRYMPKTLACEIRTRGRLPVEECVPLGITLCLALGHLHRQGLIHRDVKPSNIIFVNGVPKLADIGLVTDLAGADSFVGTEGFIPPEGPNSPQADLYALGKVLYEASMGKDRNEFPEPCTWLAIGEESKTLMELNAVLLRACAPKPRERYQTAEEMNADLALLHSGKSVKDKHALERRLRVTTRLAVAVVGVMILGVVPYYWAIHEAHSARREARKSDQALQFMNDMLTGVGPGVAKGRDTKLLREIMDRTIVRINKELTNEPAVEAELRDTLGQVFQALGDYAKADQMCRAAVEAARRAGSGQDELTAKLLNNLANVLVDERKLDEAEAAQRQSLELARKAFGKQHEHVAEALNNLGITLHWEGKLEASERAHGEALTMQQKLFGAENEAVALSLMNLGAVLKDEGRFAEAEVLNRQALEVCRKLLGDDDLQVSHCYDNLGSVLSNEGKLGEAEDALQQSVNIMRKIVGTNHPALAIALINLGQVQRARHELGEASATLTEALSIARKEGGSKRDDVAEALEDLAGVYQDQHKVAEAEAACREALEIRRKLNQAGHPSIARSLLKLACLLREDKKLDEAEPPAREALALYQEKLPDDWRAFNAQLILGGIWLEQKSYSAAEPLLKSGFEGMSQRKDRVPSASRFRLRKGLLDLVRLYQETGRAALAAEWQQKLALLDQAEPIPDRKPPPAAENDWRGGAKAQPAANLDVHGSLTNRVAATGPGPFHYRVGVGN